jgi:hypothetical protein
MIDSPLEAAEALLRARSHQAALDFGRAVRPLFAVEGDGPKPILKHAGTCILLLIDGHYVLSTAAHILDRRKDGTVLAVGGTPNRPVVPILDGTLRTTTPPQGNRDLDHYDCGFWNMPDQAVQNLGAVEFLDASRWSHNRAPVERRYYMAIGYRLNGNEGNIDHRAKTIANRVSRYSGSVEPMPKLAAALGVSGADHLFLTFPKYAQNEDNCRVNTYRPKGFSGGPLLDLGDFTLESAYEPNRLHGATLAGMLIEHDKTHRAMIAVNIGTIVIGIRRALVG